MNQEENNRPFVKEHIIPSRRKLQREFLKSLGRMFLYGAVFGIAAGLFLIMTESLLGGEKESEKQQTTPETIVTPAGITTDYKKNETVSSDSQKKELSGQEKKDSANGSYDKKIKELNQSIISVLSKSKGINGTETGMVCFGVAIAKDDACLYFLVPYDSLPPEQKELQAEFFDGSVCRAEFTGKDEDANIAVISVKSEDIPENFQKKQKLSNLENLDRYRQEVPYYCLDAQMDLSTLLILVWFLEVQRKNILWITVWIYILPISSVMKMVLVLLSALMEGFLV